jgi:fluoride ion exporter CrcB/FEX
VSEWFTGLGTWLAWLLTHKVVLLCAGGAIGTLARHLLTTWIGAPLWARGFPIATFLINVSGSFILGAAVDDSPAQPAEHASATAAR